MTLERAYSVLDVKSMDDDKREIVGIATTPSTDRMGDIVEPKGAEFKLPLPLLWQHNHDAPIGHVISAKATAAGIEVKCKVASVSEAGPLKDRLDNAWQAIKAGLVRGFSIGFRSLEASRIDDTWAQRFIRWEWLELSAVTVPANADCSITAIKTADQAIRRAASGARPVVRLDSPPAHAGPPGVSGSLPRRKGVVYLN